MKHRRHTDLSAFESGTWGTDAAACPPDPALAAHVDGELDAARSAAIEAHLDRCRVCDSEARRLEGLSHLLRAWDVAHPEVVPPPRLASRILRDVEVESGVRRRESLASFRRVRAKAAAAVLVVALGAALGARAGIFGGASEAPALAPGSLEGPVLSVLWDPGPAGDLEVPPMLGLADVARAEGLSLAVAALRREPSPDLAVFSDPAAKESFASWATLVETTHRLGEECVLLPDGRAIPLSAVEAWQSMRRWKDWMDERLRRASEPPTRDPSDVGTPLARLLPLPSEDGVTAFWDGLVRVEDPATRRHGGLVLRALPAPLGVSASAAGPAPAIDRMIDLADAVRAGTVRLLEDLQPNPEVVVVQVRGLESPVLVPAGELLTGGIAPRVVARGTWLPAGSDAYQAKLFCRAVGPVARSSASSAGAAAAARAAPAPTGLLAGPELRGALARGESAEGVRALVRAQLHGAALDAATGGLDLLRLYLQSGAQGAWPEGQAARDASDLARRARDLVAALGTDARGFVATDPNGRLQGAESIGVGGAAGRALLARLAAGYLAEAGARSSVDAPRLGVHAESVLSVLAARPVRLTPLAAAAGSPRSLRVLVGEEPRTGVAFEAVAADGGAIVLSSGLVPDVK